MGRSVFDGTGELGGDADVGARLFDHLAMSAGIRARRKGIKDARDVVQVWRWEVWGVARELVGAR